MNSLNLKSKIENINKNFKTKNCKINLTFIPRIEKF